jgi:phosphoribosylformylglycinamidine cyclo-ligase
MRIYRSRILNGMNWIENNAGKTSDNTNASKKEKKNNMSDSLSYAKSGINIDETDAVKREMKSAIDKGDPRMLNTLGAFGSLVDGRFNDYAHPILVLKTEEPGSKQKLAFQHNSASSIAYDLINHLINDIIVMGADPIYAQDCIICGKIEPEIVKLLVHNIAAACGAQDCVLTGGETSVQPGVIADGEYVLSASAIGVVDKKKIIDGSRIVKGDSVLAVASNGLHTNGYTLVRKLIEMKPDLLDSDVDGESFLNTILRPHKCYYMSARGLFDRPFLKGMAHITGGGVQDNLSRILPDSLDALIDLRTVKIPRIFEIIRTEGNVTDSDMLRTFNMGIGLAVVVQPESATETITHFKQSGCECYEIGSIVDGQRKVRFEGSLNWQ